MRFLNRRSNRTGNCCSFCPERAASLAAETDDQSDDLIPQAFLDTQAYQDLQNGVTQVASTLEAAVPISVTDYTGQPFALDLYAGRFFVPAIEDLKTKFPNHTFDVNGDPQLTGPITFPDPTINGIFPDMTNDRWRAVTGLNVMAARTPR